MARILVVDDHSVVREGVKYILAETPDLRVAGEAGNAREAYEQLDARTWDMVLLDIALPGKDGFEVLSRIRRTYPNVPVLVFSIHPGNQYAMRAFKQGAAGYLSKDSLPAELITAIRRVLQGGRYVSQTLAEELVLGLTQESNHPLHGSLSAREHQVLCLLGVGHTVSEIARELDLSVKTISTYRARALEKLQLKTTADLIHYAIHYQLVQ